MRVGSQRASDRCRWVLQEGGAQGVQVFITEIADPRNNAGGRFVELYSVNGQSLTGPPLWFRHGCVCFCWFSCFTITVRIRSKVYSCRCLDACSMVGLRLVQWTKPSLHFGTRSCQVRHMSKIGFASILKVQLTEEWNPCVFVLGNGPWNLDISPPWRFPHYLL